MFSHQVVPIQTNTKATVSQLTVLEILCDFPNNSSSSVNIQCAERPNVIFSPIIGLVERVPHRIRYNLDFAWKNRAVNNSTKDIFIFYLHWSAETL